MPEKERRYIIGNIILYLKTKKKVEHTKPKANRRKEIKIRANVKETESSNTIGKIKKVKADSLKNQ